jgi:hypothetical protein
MNVRFTGQVIAQDLREDSEFFETPEGPADNDNSFMGYAIATGHFNNDTLQGACCCSFERTEPCSTIHAVRTVFYREINYLRYKTERLCRTHAWSPLPRVPRVVVELVARTTGGLSLESA